MKYDGPVTVWRRYDGREVEYSCLAAAVRSCGYVSCMATRYGFRSKGTYYPSFDQWIYGKGDDYVFYIDGIVIPVWKVHETAEQFCDDKYYRYYRYRQISFVFRKGPVGGIRRWRWGGRRHPKRFQTIRDNAFLRYDEDALEHNLGSTKSKSESLMEHGWDDPYVPHFRCWKKFRKTKWKDR